MNSNLCGPIERTNKSFRHEERPLPLRILVYIENFMDEDLAILPELKGKRVVSWELLQENR